MLLRISKYWLICERIVIYNQSINLLLVDMIKSNVIVGFDQITIHE